MSLCDVINDKMESESECKLGKQALSCESERKPSNAHGGDPCSGRTASG